MLVQTWNNGKTLEIKATSLSNLLRFQLPLHLAFSMTFPWLKGELCCKCSGIIGHFSKSSLGDVCDYF